MFVLPVTRDVPTRHTAWVVYSLIVANSLVFLATWSPSSVGSIGQRFGFIPANHEWGTIFTSMFLHGSFFHILGNMFFLLMFGERVENTLGHLLTTVCYLACGVCGTGLLYLVDPHSKIPCIGASGAISGMVGMYMVLFPAAKMDLVFYLFRFKVGTIRASAVAAVLVWLVEQSLLGLVTALLGWRFGIGFMAHVGGLLAGAVLGLGVILLGISPDYRRMMAKKSSRRLTCPACGADLPWLSPGHHNCLPCGATFRVDEQGDTAVSDPAERKAPPWLIAAILLPMFAGIVRLCIEVWHSGR
jgi:membrane associated rhomboid family serine protease